MFEERIRLSSFLIVCLKLQHSVRCATVYPVTSQDSPIDPDMRGTCNLCYEQWD